MAAARKVVEYVVLPAVKERNSSLAHTLDERHLHNTKYDGHYVSVPYEVGFNGFVTALKDHFAGRDPAKVLWISPARNGTRTRRRTL